MRPAVRGGARVLGLGLEPSRAVLLDDLHVGTSTLLPFYLNNTLPIASRSISYLILICGPFQTALFMVLPTFQLQEAPIFDCQHKILQFKNVKFQKR